VQVFVEKHRQNPAQQTHEAAVAERALPDHLKGDLSNKTE